MSANTSVKTKRLELTEGIEMQIFMSTFFKREPVPFIVSSPDNDKFIAVSISAIEAIDNDPLSWKIKGVIDDTNLSDITIVGEKTYGRYNLRTGTGFVKIRI